MLGMVQGPRDIPVRCGDEAWPVSTQDREWWGLGAGDRS